MPEDLDQESDTHQIGGVADAVGFSLRMIRRCGKVGLTPESGRKAGGLCLYTDRDVERLVLIKYMKPLDFTLEEMMDLLETRDRLANGSDGVTGFELAGKLSTYASTADRRCDGLRVELEAAESMAAAAKLRNEASAHYRIRSCDSEPGFAELPTRKSPTRTAEHSGHRGARASGLKSRKSAD